MIHFVHSTGIYTAPGMIWEMTKSPGITLLLFLFGRQAHTHVELTGPAEITSRMRTARYGI